MVLRDALSQLRWLTVLTAKVRAPFLSASAARCESAALADCAYCNSVRFSLRFGGPF